MISQGWGSRAFVVQNKFARYKCANKTKSCIEFISTKTSFCTMMFHVSTILGRLLADAKNFIHMHFTNGRQTSDKKTNTEAP